MSYDKACVTEQFLLYCELMFSAYELPWTSHSNKGYSPCSCINISYLHREPILVSCSFLLSCCAHCFTTIGMRCHKYHFCHDKHETHLLSRQRYACREKTFAATKACLSRQNILVKSNIPHDKHVFVTTKVLSRQAYFCHDKDGLRVCRNKYTFVVTEDVFCRDKKDTFGSSSQWYFTCMPTHHLPSSCFKTQAKQPLDTAQAKNKTKNTKTSGLALHLIFESFFTV